MKQKMKSLSLLGAIGLLLTGCLGDVNPESEAEELGPNQSTATTTANQLSSNNYRAVIIDGQYQLGASASSDMSLSSANNTKAFEEGLVRISQEVFPTDQYYFQEGQLIDEDTMTSWLARESPTNPEGLNPAAPDSEEVVDPSEAESVDPADDPEDPTQEMSSESSGESGSEADQGDESNEEDSESTVDPAGNSSGTPIYISQLLEKNLMVETDDGYALSGIVLGLAMNSTYEYTDENGIVHEQEISVGEMRERGKQYANIIVGRLRNTEELRNIPIVVGLFRVAPNDEVAGGVYMTDGISREGNSVTEWTERNEYRVALPIVAEEQTNDQFVYFDQFQNDVLNFFPNLNGISGEALYIDDGLASLTIDIVTQFYQHSEITALTQHVTDMAQRHLPDGVRIEINIKSTAGMEAFVGRPAEATEYQTHVFY